MRRLPLAVVAAALLVGGATCQPSGHVVQYAYSVTTQSGTDQYPLNADSSLVPSINPGAPEPCASELTSVIGRHDYCRLVWGWDGNGDYRNWVIRFTADGQPGGSPPAYTNVPYYGYSLTLADGQQYEGCSWFSPDDSWTCDYQITNSFIDGGSTCGLCLGYFLDKLWDWSHYELSSDIGCAKGLYDVVTKGVSITNTFLIDCTDTPYRG